MKNTGKLPGPLSSQILLYTSADGQTRIEVKLRNETVWLTQAQMAQLFQKDVRTINEHIINIFDVIISVGYRVKSLRGTQFLIWATIHNLHFFGSLMESVRQSIAEKSYRKLMESWLG